MENRQTKHIIEILESFFTFLYNNPAKIYVISINWFEEKLNIFIKEYYKENNILDLTIKQPIENYHIIKKEVINLVINNDDTFGYLTTTNINNVREIQNQVIKTKNLEITLPIYDSFDLLYAEYINNMMLDNMNNKQNKQKFLLK